MNPWEKGGRDRAGSGSQAKWWHAGPVGPLVKGCMSAGAGEDEVRPPEEVCVSQPCISRAPRLPALAPNAVLKVPGLRQGW